MSHEECLLFIDLPIIENNTFSLICQLFGLSAINGKLLIPNRIFCLCKKGEIILHVLPLHGFIRDIYES